MTIENEQESAQNELRIGKAVRLIRSLAPPGDPNVEERRKEVLKDAKNIKVVMESVTKELERGRSRVAANMYNQVSQSQEDSENLMSVLLTLTRESFPDERSLREDLVHASKSMNLINVIDETHVGSVILVFEAGSYVLECPNPEDKGKTLKVELGPLEVHVEVNTSGLRVNVLPGRDGDTAIASGHVHPHVNPSGGVCWGDVAATANSMASSWQLEGTLLLLNEMLGQYNSASPYVRLAAWVGYHPCKRCGRIAKLKRCPDCSYDFCKTCSVVISGSTRRACMECRPLCPCGLSVENPNKMALCTSCGNPVCPECRTETGCGARVCPACTWTCEECEYTLCVLCRLAEAGCPRCVEDDGNGTGKESVA